MADSKTIERLCNKDKCGLLELDHRLFGSFLAEGSRSLRMLSALKLT